MNVNDILTKKVTEVDKNICKAFFVVFANRYNLTREQVGKALDNFGELQAMDITLGLALTTAITTAKF